MNFLTFMKVFQRKVQPPLWTFPGFVPCSHSGICDDGTQIKVPDAGNIGAQMKGGCHEAGHGRCFDGSDTLIGLCDASRIWSQE